MILLFIVGIVFIYIMISFFLYKHSKLKGSIFILCPIVLLVGWWVLAANHYFVSSTNLEYESIEEYRLQDTLTIADIHSFGSFEKRESDDGYFYDLRNLYLSTDKENKIVSLSTKVIPIETSSGLKKGIL